MANTDENTALATAKTPPAKLSLGARLAQMNPEDLQNAVIQKLEGLQELGTDPSVPAALQQVVLNLAALASTAKPGMEEVQTAWRIPRINMAQPTSQSEAKPESAKNGDIYTTAGQLLERPYGLIPIYFYEENINFPQNGKNPVCSSPDGKLGSPYGECLKCPHLPFGKQNGGRGDQQKTDCQSNITCVALSADLKQVVQVQFGKTSRKTGSALLQLAGQQTHVWKQSYLLNTEKKTGEVGVYYVYKIEPTGKENDPNVMKLAFALYELFNAERQRMLGDWYSRPMRAPQAAVEAEGQFSGGALEAGLGEEAGVEPDLSKPAATTGTTARSSSKPM
jgi:hypothetical protein